MLAAFFVTAVSGSTTFTRISLHVAAVPGAANIYILGGYEIMIELLAPAGSIDSLRAAVHAGADAVYIGGTRFGARAYAENPEETELLRGLDYCHLHGRKLYLTVNTLQKEEELSGLLYSYLLPYYCAGLDGVIVQDFGVAAQIREQFPALPVHASTQMTVTGPDGARLLQRIGITRVVTARELSLDEIRRIIDETGIEVETFVHGALCYSYSGQCLLSSMIGGRSGNRGRCAQPCRLPYQLFGEDGTAGGGTSCLLSMKDLCTLELLPELVDAGISSLKIEGRMKRPEYTAGVVEIYRRYLDRCCEGQTGRQEAKLKSWSVSDRDHRILLDLYNRGGFTDGYYHRANGPEMMSMDRPNHFGTEAVRVVSGKNKTLQGKALEPLQKGDVLELHEAPVSFSLREDIPEGGKVALPKAAQKLHPGMMLYRTKSEALLEDLRKRYLDQDFKEKIKGDLMISCGAPAILRLEMRDMCVTVSTKEPIQAASTQAATREAVEKQIRKLGETPFHFESLSISLEDGVFVPVRELNDLRRRGAEALQEAILSPLRREMPAKLPSAKKTALSAPASPVTFSQGAGSKEEQSGTPAFTVSVQTEDQLRAVLCSAGIGRIAAIFLDPLAVCQGRYQVDISRLAKRIADIHEQGCDCYLNLPPVLRSRDRALLEQQRLQGVLQAVDGFLIHTIDELAYLHEAAPGGLRIAGDTLYAYNRKAQSFLRAQGIDRFTLPAELNFRELRTLDTEGSELVFYGYQALMQSAQCLWKNTDGCTRIPGVRYLKDRRGVTFPVRNRCAGCCNTIYNSVPLLLDGCRREIEVLSPAFLRLSFTVESGAETAQVLAGILSGYHSGSVNGIPEITRGHFKRGVE